MRRNGGGATTRRGSSISSSSLPRSFWDACMPLAGPDGTTVCWPRGATAPDHLRFFCFPASLIERLRFESTAGEAPDGFGFTFSFTASDGSVRWGCAVTGSAEAPGGGGGALTALSVALISDWPLLRPMLDVCKELFRSEQRGRISAVALSLQLRPLAVSYTHLTLPTKA